MSSLKSLLLLVSMLSSASFVQAQALIPLKVAVVVPLTGLLPGPAKEVSNAAQLAINDARADFKTLGYDLKLELFDDRSNVEEVKNIAKKILADKSVLAVVGALNSGLCIPLNEALAPSHLAVISPICAANAVTEKGLANVNRLGARNSDIGNAAARFMVRSLKVKRVVAVDDNTVFGIDFSRSVQATLKLSDVQVVDNFSAIKLEDYPAAAARVAKSQAELVNLGFTSYEAMANFIKALRKAGYSGEVMCSATFGGPEVVKLIPQELPGIMYASFGGPLIAYPNERVPLFAKRYTRQFKDEATFYSLLGYDTTQVVIQALKQSVVTKNHTLPERSSVEVNIRTIILTDALTGSVSFNSVGDRSEVTVYVMRYGADLKPKLVSQLTNTPSK